MVDVSFDALVLEMASRVSKSGNAYVILSFLDVTENDVYRVFVFGDAVAAAAGLAKGVRCTIDFWLKPSRNGGVELELAGLRNYQGKEVV